MDMDMTGLGGYESGGMAFVGCIIAGSGLGLLFHQLVPATVIGVGVGFIGMAFFRGR